jgi:Flp pilus assembly protein TadB
MLFLILLLTFIDVFLLTIFLYRAFMKNVPLSRIDNYFSQQELPVKKTENSGDRLNVFLKKTQENPLIKRLRRGMETMLRRTDIKLDAGEVILIIFALILTMSVVTSLISGNILFGIVSGAVIYLASNGIIRFMGQKRAEKINQQMSDAIDMISGSLKAGYSFMRSLERVGEEMPPPISIEFSKVVRETDLSITVEEALTNMTDRVSDSDLGLLVTAIAIQRQVGGNLSEVMDNISDTIRDRISIKRELKTLTAQGRLSGYIMALIPVILGVVLSLLDPDYLSVLFKTRIGNTILILALAGEAAGFLIIRRILNVRY